MSYDESKWGTNKAILLNGDCIGRGDQIQLKCTGERTVPKKLDGVWVTVHRVSSAGGIRVMVDGEMFARKIKQENIQAYRKAGT